MKKKDPTSHRIIEKRRRDRMNNCLTDLSRLIPAHYIKKGRGRVEKTEIIEMAIKYLKDLIEAGAAANSTANGAAGGAADGLCPRPEQMPPAHQNQQANNHNHKQRPLHKRRNSSGRANTFCPPPAPANQAPSCNLIGHFQAVESDSEEEDEEEADANNQQENKDCKLTTGNNAPPPSSKPCSSLSNWPTAAANRHHPTSQNQTSSSVGAAKMDRMSPSSSNSGSDSSGYESGPATSGQVLAGADGALDMSFHEHSIAGRFGKSPAGGAGSGNANASAGQSRSQVVAWYKKVLLVRAYSRSQQR